MIQLQEVAPGREEAPPGHGLCDLPGLRGEGLLRLLRPLRDFEGRGGWPSKGLLGLRGSFSDLATAREELLRLLKRSGKEVAGLGS